MYHIELWSDQLLKLEPLLDNYPNDDLFPRYAVLVACEALGLTWIEMTAEALAKVLWRDNG